MKNKVFSFDLVSNDPSVIACDMSNVCVVVKLPLNFEIGFKIIPWD